MAANGLKSRTKRITLEERRRRVAALLLRRVRQYEIAAELGVNPSTVTRDVQALRAQWRDEALGDIAAMKGLELAELSEMERDACLQYAAAPRDPRWLALRLKIKDRRAKLLGMDAPLEVNLDLKTAGELVMQLAALTNRHMPPDRVDGYLADVRAMLERMEQDQAHRAGRLLLTNGSSD